MTNLKNDQKIWNGDQTLKPNFGPFILSVNGNVRQNTSSSQLQIATYTRKYRVQWGLWRPQIFSRTLERAKTGTNSFWREWMRKREREIEPSISCILCVFTSLLKLIILKNEILVNKSEKDLYPDFWKLLPNLSQSWSWRKI